MSSRDAVTAVRRFGLGARADELKKVAADPRGHVLAGLSDKSAALLTGPGLSSTREIYKAASDANAARRDAPAAMDRLMAGTEAEPKSEMASRPHSSRGRPGADMAMAASTTAAQGERIISPGEILHRAYISDATVRITRAQTTEQAFIERLVMFWSNHFCVGGGKGRVVGIVGAYEREAIRPHVLGRFAEMQLAVAQHPAMLMYLDNVTSMGPSSSYGVRHGKGLNENLAREILELHTLGVKGGYTQADVTNLARLLTGWSTVDNVFQFLPDRHEPGAWQVLGKTYQSGSVEAGRSCLVDIARHPSTARFVATKLATHFVADEPPAALVEQLAATFRQSDGDLAAVAAALVKAPEAWAEPARKSVPPYDFAISLGRAFGMSMEPSEVMRISNALGQPLWKPNSPKGFPDGNDAWIGSAAMRERLRIAEAMARKVDSRVDPRQIAQALFGGSLGASTRQAIARAEAREQGLELLIMSPEFQRR